MHTLQTKQTRKDHFILQYEDQLEKKKKCTALIFELSPEAIFTNARMSGTHSYALI